MSSGLLQGNLAVFGEDFPVIRTGKYKRKKIKPLFGEWKSTQFREAKG
jgi:hypothetical protein